MAGEGKYAQTNTQFATMSAAAIRDPVLNGPGVEAMQDAVRAFQDAAASLAAINDEMSAIEKAYAEAHEGDAAEMTKVYLRKLGEPGRVGVLTFEGAAAAMEDQGAHFTAARSTLEALGEVSDVEPNDEETSTPDQLSAVKAASEYQDRANRTLASAFPMFTPLTIPPPDATAPPAVATPDWGYTSGAGSAAALSPASASASGGPAVPSVAAASQTGASATGAGGSVGGVVPATALPSPSSQVGSGSATTNRLPAGPEVPTVGSVPASASGSAGGGGAIGSGRTADLGLSGRNTAGVGSVAVPWRGDAVGTGGLGTSPRTPGVGGGGRIADAGGVSRSVTGGERLTGTRGLAERAAAGAAAEENAAARGQTGARQSSSHMPLMPGGAAAARTGETRPRPDWLVEDDPEGFWLADVPEYGPSVLGGDDGEDR